MGSEMCIRDRPVDAVVEQHDGDVHVAPQGVDQVVAADAQRVAITAVSYTHLTLPTSDLV